ncbi:MAG TPA: PVC-type heme-binding CxxCH protein [Tepidisphaeraceae bacterium]|nr:PVC-type heme-binding CxxCH protein [Tepidisphaeraceae bacterium]
MHPHAIGVAAVVSAVVVLPARAQDVAPDFVLPHGLEAKVWASTPQLFNPTNIDVDARGRIWVTEGVNYRETYKQQNALKHPEGDRIVILEDTDGDGVADSSKVFAQDRDLICPLGIAVIGDKVIVSCSPHLIVYTDANCDDVPDKKEILLTGFGGFDHDHGLHSVVGGLDGRWYFNVGNMGPHDVTDKSGWRLHSGSCYVYGNNGNTGNRKSDDGRVWTGGIPMRIDPDGTNLKPLAHNFRNSYETPIDSFGDIWQSDNDDDGNQGCRLAWVMEGGNYGFFSQDGTRTWRTDQRPGQNTQAAHWHSDDPGVMPPGDITGAGGPTGVVVYEGGLLPEDYVGAVLNCDTGRNRVWMHMPKPSGAGFTFDRGDFIAAKIADDAAGEEARKFRPSDIAIGTDGAVYVSDWYDPTTGGHNIRDKHGAGRILRIAPKGDQTKAPKIDLSTTDGQLAVLNSPAINVRHVAANKLAEKRDSQTIERLQAMAASDDAVQRARAMWVLARCGDAGAAAVEGMLESDNPRTRLVAFRALRSVDHHVLDLAKQLADDPSPAVRREVAIALRDVSLEKCEDALVKLAKGYDGKDRFYLEAFGIACDGKEAAIYPVLLEQLGNADSLKWSESFAGIAWRLHPTQAIDALAARAASAGLSAAARAQALSALAFIHDERAARAMSSLARSATDDVRPLAEWWIAHRVSNDWKEFAAARHHVSPDPAKSDPSNLARLEEDRNQFLDESAAKRSRDAAARRLADDPKGAKFLLALAAEGKFPKGFTDTVADRLHKSGDLTVRAMASEYFPRQGAGGAPLPPIKELAAMKGDAARGRAVFFGNTAGCAKCHQFNGEGKNVGPDLSAIRTKFGRPELLDSILNPSAAIAFGYEAWIVKTKHNDVYSGFILADSAENFVLKDSSGEQRTIPAKDIALRKRQTISVMPDNVALGLNAQELADLAEFLQTAPVQAAP